MGKLEAKEEEEKAASRAATANASSDGDQSASALDPEDPTPSSAQILALTARSSEFLIPSTSKENVSIEDEDLQVKKKAAADVKTAGSQTPLPLPQGLPKAEVSSSSKSSTRSSGQRSLDFLPQRTNESSTMKKRGTDTPVLNTGSGGAANLPGAFRQRGIDYQEGPDERSGDLIQEVLQLRSDAARLEGQQATSAISSDRILEEPDEEEPTEPSPLTMEELNPSIPENTTNNPPDPSQFLVEATLVDERSRQLEVQEDQPPTVQAAFAEAKPMDEAEMASSFFKTRAGRSLIFLVLLVITGLVVGLVAGFTVGRDNGNTPTTASPTLAPTLLTESDVFQSLLIDLELEEETMDHPETPRYQALIWLLEDPFLSRMAVEEKRQRFALMTLYYATEGDHWESTKGWGRYEANECTWSMRNFNTEHCGEVNNNCDLNGNVNDISLTSNNMNGTLPVELSLLSSSLLYIGMQRNSLHDELPSEIGLLSALISINLGSNGLDGKIPSELGNLLNLTYIDFSKNLLTGQIPTQLGLFKGLYDILLQDNNLSGSLPSELFVMENLGSLDVSSNSITGSLPPELTISINLDRVVLNNNSISGTLPAGLLNSVSLQSLELRENQFTGSIPSDLSHGSLSTLDIGSNLITGVIPSEIGLSHQLCKLNVSNNDISGTIPAELGHLCLGEPGLGRNNSQFLVIWGSIYASSDAKNQTLEIVSYVDDFLASALEKFYDDFEDFHISYQGAFQPSQFGLEISVVCTVYFDAESQMPDSENVQELLFYSVSLDEDYEWVEETESGFNETRSTYLSLNSYYIGEDFSLDFSNNSLTGPLPGELFGPGSLLHTFDVQGNGVSGSIPAAVGLSKELSVICLANNEMAGTIPSELGLLGLESFDIHSNAFSGTIPSGLWAISSLQFLDMSQNQLSGSILLGAELLQLEFLDMSSNRLSGSIPSAVGLLGSICDMNLSNNMFSGSIPAEIGLLCFRQALFGPSSVAIPVNLRMDLSGLQDFSAEESDGLISGLQKDASEALTADVEFEFEEFIFLAVIPIHDSFVFDTDVEGHFISLNMIVLIHFRAGSNLPELQELAELLESAHVYGDNTFPFVQSRSACNSMDEWKVKVLLNTTVSLEDLPPIHLDVSFNNLNGTIPTELAQLSSPGSEIRLIGNNFTGSLPGELCPWLCGTMDKNSSSILEVDCDQIRCPCDCF